MKPLDSGFRNRLHEAADYGPGLNVLKKVEEVRQQHGLSALDAIGFVHAQGLAVNVRGGPERRVEFNIKHGREFGARLREHPDAAELENEYDNAPDPAP